MLKPHPNVESRGLVHKVLKQAKQPNNGVKYFCVCGYVIGHTRSHSDTDAPVTCMKCLAE
jgi:hypothetical protein